MEKDFDLSDDTYSTPVELKNPIELWKEVSSNRVNSNIKLKAFKGDALASFFARECICKREDHLGRRWEESLSRKITSNIFFKEVCEKLGLHPLAGHDYGTAYEAALYDIYEHSGFEEARRFFRETVFHYYLNKQR